MRQKLILHVSLLVALLAGFAPAPTLPAAAAESVPSIALGALAPSAPQATTTLSITATQTLTLSVLGTYSTGIRIGALSTAEIVAHDPVSQTVYVVNPFSGTVDIVSIANPVNPVKLTSIVISPTYGAAANSVDVYNGLVALAVEPITKTNAGSVVFFDRSGNFLNQVTAGALPDMLTFTPDGTRVLVANEGEPSSNYALDPEGSITVVDISAGVNSPVTTHISFTDFNTSQPRNGEITALPDNAEVRFTRPFSHTVAENIEPEYIAVAPDGSTAWVSLQENNAMAVLDLDTLTIERLVPLGFKDMSLAGNGFDGSDQDGPAINIGNDPVWGMYMPDAIASYSVGGQWYLVTANEGDAREYTGWIEALRVGNGAYQLDATFPNSTTLKTNAQLGRLNATRFAGDTDLDGDYDEIYVFGARSFSIWNVTGPTTPTMVFDSGDHLEQATAAIYGTTAFNATHDDNTSFDNRSDDKGPEPEAATTGVIGGRTYAFVGLERVGGIMVYDVTDPLNPVYVTYVNRRDFAQSESAAAGGDLGPEGIIFISASDSPTGKALVAVANEISGTVTFYEISLTDPDGAGTLTLLHNNDGESSLLPINYPVAPGTGYPNTTTVNLNIGGVSAYKTLVDNNIDQAHGAGNAVVNVYAGDSFLASATLVCSLPVTATTPVYDAIAQRQIAYDAHIFGNHEFDYTPDFLLRFILAFTSSIGVTPTQPFLSANLGFGGEAAYAGYLDSDGLVHPNITDGRVIGRALILTDTATGQRFGIVGATTWTLPTISSPRNVTVTADLTSTAAVVQAEIDRLINTFGVQKIILVSHLQDVNNDKALIPLLTGVDIAVAGGGDELLLSSAVPTQTQLLPGEAQTSAGAYPVQVTDATSRTVYVVTTAGNYKYMGRLDVEFDGQGEVTRVITETSYSRRVIPTSATATALGLADAVTQEAGMVASVDAPVQACLNDLAATPVARSEVLLDVSRNSVRGHEANAGNLIADAFVYMYDQLAATNGLPARSSANPVIGVQNGGGIRQNAGNILPTTGVTPGLISRLDTINVLPFENYLTVVTDVTPIDLKTIFERSASGLPGAGGQFLQVSGITVTLNLSASVNNRVWSLTLADGTAIVVAGVVAPGAPTVSLVTNSFTADGGDNYPTLAANVNQLNLRKLDDTLIFYEEAWRLYLQSLPVTSGVGGDLPTVLASDPRYNQLAGYGRIVIAALRVYYLPIIDR